MNKVMLLGSVEREPEIKYLDHDVCVARVRLATTERGYTLANGTEVPDRTEWHNVLLWNKLAKVVENSLHPGDTIFVEGSLRWRSYVDRNGAKRTTVEVVAESIEILAQGTPSQGPVTAS